MSKNTKILTGWVHRLVDGILESHGPGEPAPDWVTNPALVTDALPAPKVEPVEPAGDDLDALDGKTLKALADEVGVAKSGSLDTIRDRIRAKRAADSEDTADDRDSLAARAAALGFEVDDNLSEVELQALIDSKE